MARAADCIVTATEKRSFAKPHRKRREQVFSQKRKLKYLQMVYEWLYNFNEDS
jgi:hypothetical protein